MAKKKNGKRKTKPIQDLIDIKSIVSLENTATIPLKGGGEVRLGFGHSIGDGHYDIPSSEAKSLIARLIELTLKMLSNESITIVIPAKDEFGSSSTSPIFTG
jgi:hypothetical protein